MSTPIDDGGPAYPVECYYGTDGSPVDGIQTSNVTGWHRGLSLRDYFAAQAMQALIPADDNGDQLDGTRGFRRVSEAAYACADAMIEARKAP